MKNKALTLVVMMLIGMVSFAQISLKVKSGDTELDTDLNEINVSAEKDFGVFKLDMKTSYNVTEKKIDDLKVSFGMQASDIFMTLELAKSSGKSVDDVAAVFKKSKGKGWGEIAKELGIKPGSDAFHALKGKAKKQKDKGKGNAKVKVKATESKGNGNGKAKGKK